MTTLGDRLYALRVAKGWSRPALAERAGVTKQTIFDIERGATKNPHTITLQCLAGALRVEVEDLLKNETKIFAPAPLSFGAGRRPHLAWNAAKLRPRILEQISPNLSVDPLETTRFVDHLEMLRDYRWLNDPSHVQTTAMEFSEIWSDPGFFIPYESTLLYFDKLGRRVDRLFVVDSGRLGSAIYVATVKQVLLRHRALGLRPRILPADRAYSMNKDLGAVCDIIMILDAKWSLIGNYLLDSAPAFLRTDNNEFSTHASNIFKGYWESCPDSEVFLRNFPPTDRENGVAARDAELVHVAWEISRSR